MLFSLFLLCLIVLAQSSPGTSAASSAALTFLKPSFPTQHLLIALYWHIIRATDYWIQHMTVVRSALYRDMVDWIAVVM